MDVPEGLADGSLSKYVLKRVISKTSIEFDKIMNSNMVFAPSPPPNESRATEWILTDFMCKNSRLEAKDFEVTLTLDFAQKKVFGQSPCNRYFGTLRDLDKNRVRFENIGKTTLPCNFTDKEKSFFESLPLAQNFVIEGSRMYIYHGKELLLAFKRR